MKKPRYRAGLFFARVISKQQIPFCPLVQTDECVSIATLFVRPDNFLSVTVGFKKKIGFLCA